MDYTALLLAVRPDAAKDLLAILIVFASAKIAAELFERMNQAGIVGEILVGILIGPSILNWIAPNQLLTTLAELGVIFLLFRVGLEVKSSDLLKVGGTALVVAVAGVALPFVLGWGILLLWGEPQIEAIFVGAAMVATSVGITAQVLAAKGLLHLRASRIIMAAAVIDDVLGLLVLALVSSLAKGKINLIELSMTTAVASGFTIVVAMWGTKAMDKVMPRANQLRVTEAQFAVAISILFGLSVLAIHAGVAAIVGAFLAGMALSESVSRRVLDLTNGVTELLVPFFLVGIGLQLNLAAFASLGTMLLAAIILIVAILTKVLGCGFGAYKLGRKDAVRVGVGMIPRGEVGMVVAQIGLSLGVIAQGIYGVVVFMSVATTLVAPPLLTWAYREMIRPGEEDADQIRLG
jgi:Kef-type K+ transport system membrane component KefB